MSAPNGLPAAGPGTGRRRGGALVSAALLTAGFIVMLYVIEFADVISGQRLEQEGGIRPLETDGLVGILFAPVLHADWAHLYANTFAVAILGFMVLASGIGRGIAATAIIWVIGGVGTWLTGGIGTLHVGASLLIFGWLTYLIVRGVFNRSIGQLAIGVIVFLVYGTMLFGVLPGQTGISWQGHLFGAIGGVVAGAMLSRKRTTVGGGGAGRISSMAR
ncbi:rhomboid family intramembrane serine protease [Millisia brevis]|uniref:rhomboid family intramembrane serine protease n=1 Tax=Millisia brevis TaxID=264148 RepID=UPI0009FDCBF6|nr:rhomboid family intramembrane serine protease [Millisia brevis]